MISLWQVTRALFEGDSKLLVSQLRALGPQADDAEGLTVDRSPFFQQLGLAARPLVSRTLRAVGVEHGDEVAVLAMFDKALTPTDLEEGETRLYAAGTLGNFVRMLAARVVVEAPEIRMGANASKKVNREGDPLRPGTLTVSATTSTLTITYTAPDGGGSQSVDVAIGGSPAVFTPLSPTTITLAGKTGAGSNKLRAED